jgi:DNA-directed RNA polymerase subunit RPC12/RpoP
MIKFRCSNCNKKFGVPDDYAGRRIRCNTCDHHTFVPKPVTDSDRAAAAEHSQADSGASVNPAPSLSAEDKPAELLFKLQPDSSEDELITAETLLNTPKSPDAEIQLQSFHHFTPSDSVVAGPEPHPAAKNTVSKLLKRCRPDPRTDRTELALNTLSFISCIGPVLFILMFFYFMMAMAVGDSPRAMAAHHTLPAEPNVVSTSDPNTLPKHNSFSAMPASRVVRYSFYAFGFVISPIALILSMILVFRYCFDMPKTLYVSIVLYGLIFFNIFRG